MKLFIDIGNSYIKIAYKNEILRYPTKVNYSLDSFLLLLPKNLKESKIQRILISSVVPSITSTIKEMAIKNWKIDPIMIEYPIKTGIKLMADNPKEVGSDLVCTAAYAASKTNEAIVVNIGTATTISHVKDKALQGTIICPGLQTSYNALTKMASKLNEITLKISNKNIGRSTEESISIGVLNGHAEMIRALVKKININNATVFLSGGASVLIKELLPEYEYVNEVTIEGMKVIEKLNYEK